MGIGACVALLATGAVLTFATDWYVAGIDLNAVGVILMVAGAIGLAVTFQIFRPRPRSSTPPQAGYQEQPPGHYAQQPYGQQPPGYGQPPPAGHYPHNPPPGGYR